jgi:hypothetical protein
MHRPDGVDGVDGVGGATVTVGVLMSE